MKQRRNRKGQWIKEMTDMTSRDVALLSYEEIDRLEPDEAEHALAILFERNARETPGEEKCACSHSPHSGDCHAWDCPCQTFVARGW